MKDIPDRERIPELYIQGQSLRAIGRQVGLTPGAVRSILVARGVPMRPTGQRAVVPAGPDHPNWRGGRVKTHSPHPRVYHSGERASHWKGGRIVWGHGKKGEKGDQYVYVYSPDHPNRTKQGYVMEHRLVMERVLGRLLTKEEVVHHQNGDKLDNRPENLTVCSRREHSRAHFDAIRQLARYEALYGPLPEDNDAEPEPDPVHE